MNVLMGDANANARTHEARKDSSNCDFLIVTRFNMYLKQYSGNRSEEQLQQWAWNRLPLFERFCMRSVHAQTFRNTNWIVLVDNGNEAIREAVGAVLPKTSKFMMHLTNRDDPPHSQIRAAVNRFRQDLNEPKEYIATFRLDCDDAINRHFIENADLYLRYIDLPGPMERPLALSFPFGMQVAAKEKYLLTYPHNPFIGLVERSDTNIQTVYAANHGYIHNIADVQYIHTRQPMWAQVVHGSNVMNSVYPHTLAVTTSKQQDIDLFSVDFNEVELASCNDLTQSCHKF
ncbi:glycosyltransferase [Microvirga sp. 0TCS3.31]